MRRPSFAALLAVIFSQTLPAAEKLSRLHFGRWRDPNWGPWLKATWAIVGIVPVIMFVTGVVMWWNRKIRHRAVRNAPEVEAA